MNFLKLNPLSVLDLLPILITLSALLTGINSEKIVLDTNSDSSGVWVDISCHYSQDYNDFWVYGCPTNPSEEPSSTNEGFWTPCGSSQTCEIIYYGGALPKPTRITFSSYIQGSSEVLISGQNSLNHTESSQQLGSFVQSPSDPTGWKDQDIDLSTLSAISVLNFTIKSSRGFVLLDKITVTLDSTTPVSIELDTGKDAVKTHWTDHNCHYMDSYEDLWVYGCPAGPVEENTEGSQVGYWSPCSFESCTIQYYNSMTPNKISVRSYVDGTAGIVVTTQGKPGLSEGVAPTVLQLISNETTGEGWRDVVLPIYSSQDHVLNFQLVPGTNGTVLLDLVYIFFNTTEDPVTTTTPTTTTTITTSTIQTTTRPLVTLPEESGQSKISPAFILPIFLLFVSILFTRLTI